MERASQSSNSPAQAECETKRAQRRNFQLSAAALSKLNPLAMCFIRTQTPRVRVCRATSIERSNETQEIFLLWRRERERERGTKQRGIRRKQSKEREKVSRYGFIARCSLSRIVIASGRNEIERKSTRLCKFLELEGTRNSEKKMRMRGRMSVSRSSRNTRRRREKWRLGNWFFAGWC